MFHVFQFFSRGYYNFDTIYFFVSVTWLGFVESELSYSPFQMRIITITFTDCLFMKVSPKFYMRSISISHPLALLTDIMTKSVINERYPLNNTSSPAGSYDAMHLQVHRTSEYSTCFLISTKPFNSLQAYCKMSACNTIDNL